ncbi:MAG: Polynucleotide adenylyltransferase region [Candidatus Solibacter sp.]|jgi:tRNA nucleotidyltransferase (CCA-adding enzyme)|nr:Polynucleotide adenylyltransferase region [Candidatus Solibacter sp.]
MSDYIYMLESHLSPDQNRAVEDVQAAAGMANVNVFLTGGAMRDMIAGFRIRDLDFVVEGNALKVAKAICEKTGATTTSTDDNRKTAEIVFPSGVTAQIGMSRQEKYARAGAKPQVTPATIQEDLRGRDFTANAIALSLNRASRGLLLDPMNGLADIERKELRAVTTYGFYDDPTRLLRLVRFKVRFGFTIEERTQMQVANAREAEVEKRIPARALGEELKRISAEDNPTDILKGLEEAGLLALFSSALFAKLNVAGLAKLEKAYHVLPDDARWRAARFGPFMHAVTENFTPKEKQALIKSTELPKSDVDCWQKTEAKAKKLETALRAPKIRKPSHVFHIVAAASPEDVLFVLYHSALKPVQERLRNHFQKYLPMVQEITPEEWATIEGKPGTPKYAKAREDFISERVNRKPPKPVEEVPPTEPPVPEPVMGGGRGRPPRQI